MLTLMELSDNTFEPLNLVNQKIKKSWHKKK